MQGQVKQAMGMMKEAADSEGYILAGSNNLNDSLSISKNILITSRMLRRVVSILPVQDKRVYGAGFDSGGRLVSILPTFIKGFTGVISFGAAINNLDVLSVRNPFHFIGIVGNEDYNYPEMLSAKKVLDKLKFPNQLFVFEGGASWPKEDYISFALKDFTIAAMAKGIVEKDQDYVERAYRTGLGKANEFVKAEQPLLAHNHLAQLRSVFQPHKTLDSINASAKTLGKTKLYRSQKRSFSTTLFKESLIKEDYSYYLEEDVLTYNYNNLGWWKYQMDELQKYKANSTSFVRQMGMRLQAYLDALIEDNLDILAQEKKVDLEAMNFLWMLKTITQSKNPESYLKVIATSAHLDDYGTALFYLEELLKSGYSDKEKLYAIENTALLRITPEFNAIVEKYLKVARYEPIED